MESKALKVGWIVMLAMVIYGLVIALLWVFGTKAVFAPAFTTFTEQSWSDFVAVSPKAAHLQLMTSRLVAAMAVAVSIIGIFMVLNSYRKGEKWSWYAFLVSGVIVWGSNLAYDITIASASGLVLMTIGLILLVIGLVVPARTILGGEAAKK